MHHPSRPLVNCPSQQSMQARCVGPTNPFIKFNKEEIEQSVPNRFEQQITNYPNRLAVKTSSLELTYDSLNRAANRVARAILAQRETGGEEPIALLLENDAPMIIAILGVLKAGKIYVPLDPSYPRARITYMLEDSQAGLIVTMDKNLSLAHELAQDMCRVINMDEIDSSLSSDNLGLSISPNALAYIIYTSGSTGQPKGVVQSHRNVLHEIMNYTNEVHISAEDRLALLSSPSFADAVRTIYGALLNGAGLYPLDIKQEGLTQLANWLIQQQITIYRSIPTVFRHFGRTLTGGKEFPKLRLIYLAGEQVLKRDVDVYKKYFSPDCILVNGLGSTESLTFRWYFIAKETPVTGSNVPVGYAVEDKETLLLDEAGEEVGFSEIGEIAVKSRYLSPGYWGRADLTRAAFLPAPQGGDERIYRTGDLGCMLPTGCLAHLGRKDFQLKIRGHRIEVAEIEMALLDLAAIKDVVVAAQEERTGDKRLVAYLVPHGGPVPNVSTLRRVLAERVPDYMIPLAFVLLDALPLAPNGKVDRRALPRPSPDRPKLDTPFIAPRTSIEEVVAEIWSEVLGIEQVGVHDNFFELGGHSLLATQVVSRIGRVFRVELPLRGLFEAPTVAELSQAIIENAATPRHSEKLAPVLKRIEGMSAKEVKNALQKKSGQRGNIQDKTRG